MAVLGYGMLVKVEGTPGSGVFTTIGVQRNIKAGGWSVDSVDTTHNQSPNKVRESMPGLTTMKPWSLEIDYSLGGAEEALVLALRGLERKFRVVDVDGGYWEADAYFNDFDPDMPTEDKTTSSIEITLMSGFTSYAAAAPTNSVLPAISGTLGEGDTLTAFEGAWANEPTSFTYQWKNATVAINGATARTYDLQASDAGDAITVTVTATNSAGSASATSAPVTADA